MKTIYSPEETKASLAASGGKVCFLDVRSEDEFKSGHVPGAVCVPLDQIESGRAQVPADKLVILSCLSGKRSAKAYELLKAKGYENLAQMEGGFSAWARAGLPVSRVRKTIPIMRQVLLTAGLFVLAGSLLAFFVDPRFVFLPMFFGAGLTFAGSTGWCGLAFLLERMPWNKTA